MERKKYIGLIAVLCLVVLASGCISSNTESTDSEQSSNSSGSGDNWKSVEKFTGTDDEETNTFKITGDKFKIKVTAAAESPDTNLEYMLFSFMAFPVGEKMYEEYETMNFTESPQTKEFVVESGPGEYYLKIWAANLGEWEVEVFDYK
jgi:hypothetical protein